jgi:septation ring formation regulator EzrA
MECLRPFAVLLRRGRKEDVMRTGSRDLRMLAATVMLVPLLAAASGADELALTIEQNLESIEFRLDLRPYQAGQDLEEQGRQLELLAKEAPNHAALPKLEEQYRALQSKAADALAEAARGEAAAQVPGPPEGFVAGLEEVEELQARAEAEMYGGDPNQARSYIEQSEAQIAALESRYRSEIPQGHVPLLVAKEKAAALKDQLADTDAR